MSYLVTIKLGKDIIKQYNPKVRDETEASQWGRKQAEALNLPDATVIVENNE